ncbi:MAG: TerB family tellurite resistance protein [Myxococcales bacterium]
MLEGFSGVNRVYMPGMRPRELLKVLDRGQGDVALADPQCQLMLTLIAHVIHADRGMTQDELDLVRPLVRNVEDKRGFFEELSQRPLDLEALAQNFPDRRDRKDLLEIAEHCLWCDGVEDEREWNLIDRIAYKLGLSRA